MVLINSLSTVPSFTRRSRKVTVNLPTVKTTNERHRAALENKADAVIAQANAVVFACGFETLEVGNLLEGSGRLHLLDDFSDSPEQRGVSDGGEVRVKRLAKRRVHATRASRRNTFLRLVSRDFSPS